MAYGFVFNRKLGNVFALLLFAFSIYRLSYSSYHYSTPDDDIFEKSIHENTHSLQDKQIMNQKESFATKESASFVSTDSAASLNSHESTETKESNTPSLKEAVDKDFCSNQRMVRITAFYQPYDMFVHQEKEDIYISDSIVRAATNGSFFEAKIRQQMVDAIGNRKGVVVLDIGANIGLHGLFLASLGHTVHAFEPFPKNYKLMECSIRKNGFKNIKLNKFGLSTRAGEFCLDVPDSSNNGHAVVMEKVSKDKCKSSVQLQRLDEYLERHVSKQPYLVKVDVEGYEFNTLITAKDYFAKNPPEHFFAEYSPIMMRRHGLDPMKFLEFFWDMGYTLQLGDGTTLERSNIATKVDQYMNDLHAFFS